MQNLCTKLFFYIFFMLFSFSNIYSTNLKLKELLDIKGVTIKSYNKVNDVAVIEYIVRAKEAFDGILKISAPNSVSDIDLKLITKNINLSKQGSEDNTVSIKLTDSEISYVSFDISVPTAPEGYKQNYYRYFKIKKTDNDISILDPREKSNLKPKEVGKDITLVSGNSNLLLSMNYNINISGRIIIDPIGGNGKGLYGNGVALWFRNSSTPGTWYHPIATHQINVNYDILDEQGNFNFNFSFTGDLSAYNQAIVIVNTANDAAYLPAPADGYISWGPNGYTNYFNESQGVVANINGSSSNIVVNQNGIINKEDGSIPRYLELAREFVIQRYAGSLPFTIAPVKTYNSNLPSGIAGQFSVDWNLNDGWFNYITIDPDYSEISTITHEYGHYIHLTMWNNEMLNWATKDENLAEGWAIFYCFAARNYINKIYGDDIYVVQYNDDNTEYAPFRPGLRYGNIRYAQGGEPMKAAISCYLWGLYDSYSGGNFEITNYNNGDNDDLSGYSNTVFESMRSLSNSFFNTITNFENEFKIRIPTESRSSVVDVNFFMFSDLTSIPSHKMRSSQITNPALSNISQSQMRISWTPQNYSSYYIEINSPSEYRIYKNVSGSWQSVASAPYGTNNSDITISSGQYKFTAYNSSGDSYGAIVKQIFTVSLPTAQYIETGSGGSYKVNGTNIGSSWNGGYLEGSSPITLEAVPPTGFRFLTWSDGNTTNPRTITPSGNMTLSATFKAHLLSGVTTGLSTTSQRKIVADSYNYLHMVYESMGSIWYCRSTDAGATWSAEQKVNIAGSNAKCPSIACSNDGLDLIYITYQSGGDLPSIDLAQYQFGSLRWRNLVDYISSYSYNANPVVTALNGYAFVIHKPTSTSAFTGKEFAINTSYNVSAVYSRGNVPNTDANSTSPSLTVYGSGGGKYYLAYQQGTTEVKYFGWGINSAYGSQESATISTGSGATSALYPSISQNVGNIIVSWTGNVPSTTNCFIRRRPYGGSWSTFQQVGSFMNYTNNNTKSGTTEDAVIGWWDTYGNRTQFIKLVSGVYGTVTTLPITGLFHISNGTSFSAMKAVIFNSNGSAPYAVNPLTYNFLTLQKETTNPALVFGRKAVVSLGETELVYCLENIKLDGENILFSGFNTAAQIKTIDDLNNLLSTDKFSLNKGSKLQFSSIYYPVRTELADSSKKEKCKINFRTELVSADDRKSISKFRDLLINKNSINDSGKVNINLDCSSIKEGEYYLRIVVDNSADVNAEYTVSDIQYEKTDGLPKGTNEELSSSGNTVVKSYDLSQNYPNPFNPSTVINYQIPEAGGVTLKVYDVLGKEVAALVDGRKDVGKYSVGFNASNLTSGIYLYELRSNDYTSSKKMILVK